MKNLFSPALHPNAIDTKSLALVSKAELVGGKVGLVQQEPIGTRRIASEPNLLFSREKRWATYRIKLTLESVLLIRH